NRALTPQPATGRDDTPATSRADQATLGTTTLETIRRNRYLEVFNVSVRAMADLPQYRYVARPINRLLGGPTQPLASAPWPAWLTDVINHQIPIALAASISERDPALLLRSWPLLSTAAVVTWGVPVGLMKRSRLLQALTVQSLANAVSPDDPT